MHKVSLEEPRDKSNLRNMGRTGNQNCSTAISYASANKSKPKRFKKHASNLRAFAKHCYLGKIEDDQLRDISPAKMLDQGNQKELLRKF